LGFDLHPNSVLEAAAFKTYLRKESSYGYRNHQTGSGRVVFVIRRYGNPECGYRPLVERPGHGDRGSTFSLSGASGQNQRCAMARCASEDWSSAGVGYESSRTEATTQDR